MIKLFFRENVSFVNDGAELKTGTFGVGKSRAVSQVEGQLRYLPYNYFI